MSAHDVTALRQHWIRQTIITSSRVWLSGCLLCCLSISAYAQLDDDLGDSLALASDSPSVVFGAQGELIEGWRARMSEFGFDAQYEPPIVSPDLGGGKFITSAMVSVQVPPGNPGFIESRVKAIEQAQLEAKGELIAMFTTEVGSSRLLEVQENASWQDGSVDEIRQLSTLDRIVKKSERLTEAALDAAIQAVDPEYDPSIYNNQQEKLAIASQVVKSATRVRALEAVAGAATVFSAEGYLNIAGVDDYQVIVSMIWTPNLQRVASAMYNKYYEIPKLNPNVPIEDQIPADPDTLIANLGVRVVVDENGQFALLSFAQAEPQYTSAGRRAKAIQRAKKIARVRAMGYLRNFVGETVSFQQSEQSSELAVEFNDTSSGVENVRAYSESRKGVAASLKLVGLQGKGEWAGKHPESEQLVAGSIIAWSPQQQEAAQALKETLSGNPAKKKESPEEEASRKGFAIESMKIKIDNY